MPVAAVVERLLRRSTLQVGIALIYHGVDPVQGSLDRDIVPPHGSQLFAEQVRHLKRRYRVVGADRLLASAAERKRGQPFPVAITFDDDLRCHQDVVLPILAPAGATATFFLTGSSLECPFTFWWERLQRAVDTGVDMSGIDGLAPSSGRPPRSIHEVGRSIQNMTPAERDSVSTALAERLGPDPAESGLRAAGVRALVDGGMRIGFHTLRHDPLPSLDDDALARAMTAGRVELEAVTGERLTVIAYPHGHVDSRVVAAARAAGFELGFTTSPKPARPGSDPLLLGRLNPSYRSTGHFALQLVRCLVRGSHQ
jgi:peptidoglycan/xylan/chitin deacetylase (PgdA/CDA1 family)